MHVSRLTSNVIPDALREIPNPPEQLFMRGRLPAGPYVAVVGTRKPTDYGRQVTLQLAGELARAGVVIVSGLALGIDGLAHQAALDSGRPTVAVLGTPIDKIYPPSHRGLGERILESGAIISEYAPDAITHRGSFVERNRLIAGLSLATIVVEADVKSGALTTANCALNQNRLVMAVPGAITNPRSAGPNNLLRAGAIPVTSAADVLNALNIESIAQTPVSAGSPEQARILELIAQGVSRSDDIIDRAGLSAAQFANLISLMEITGKVRNMGAGQWIAA